MGSNRDWLGRRAAAWGAGLASLIAAIGLALAPSAQAIGSGNGFSSAGFGLSSGGVGGMSTASYELELGAFRAHGYTGEVTLASVNGNQWLLELSYYRSVGDQLQGYVFIDGNLVKAKANKLYTALTLHGKLGRTGSLSLSFASTARFRPRRFASPFAALLGCKIPKQPARTGFVVGSLTLRTDTVLGTVSLRRAQAYLIKPKLSAISACANFGQQNYELDLGGARTPPESAFTADNYGSISMLGAVELITLPKRDPMLGIGLIAQVGAGSLFAPSSLTAASASPSGAFLNGAVQFTGTSLCATNAEFGSITGFVTASFLVGGSQTYPVPTADLMSGVETPPASGPDPFGTLTAGTGACGSDDD